MQPASLGRYRIVGVLGRGGMGVVYEGHDPQIDRPVAIKTIALEALSADEQAMFEGRFRAEMRSTGRLQHHNIAALYDTGRDGGTAYIVMELVVGHDLKRRLGAGERFSPAQAVDMTLQLLAALDFAHRRQVIHRDVKPANVMLQADGVIKLCDFGVARLADADATRTQGMVVGSLRYASPEQIMGQPIDARTDVFSTGVLLYELLTGELPFKGQSDVEVLHRIATEAAPSPRAIRPDIPPDIDGAVRRALAKDPAERFSSAAEFARALGATSFTSMDTVAAVPAPTPASVASPAGATVNPLPRRRLWLAALGSGAVLAVLGAWALLRTAPVPVPASVPVAGPAVVASALGSVPNASAPVSVSVSGGVTTAPPPPVLAASSTSIAAAAAPSSPLPGATKASAVVPRPAPTAGALSVRPADGVWPALLSCGDSFTPGFTGPGSKAFRGKVTLTVSGATVNWVRTVDRVSETASGSFDAQGRFKVDGAGAQTAPSATTWRVQARGEYLPKQKRIEARVQLLRSADGFVTRECTLVADRSATEPAVGAEPPVAAKPPAGSASASMSGELACGPVLNATANSKRQDAFTAKVRVEIGAGQVRWIRESKTAIETASGKVDANGRFTAAGTGRYKDDADGNPWQVKAQGEVRSKDGRVEAQVQLSRAKDNSLSRNCTLSAPRP